MNCIKCSGPGQDYHFTVLQVQTLHVRDLKGEKRVQALGDFEDHCVCRGCAEKKLNAILDNRKATGKAIAPFALLLAVGLILAVAFWHGKGVFRLLGMASLACGILGILGTLQESNKQRSRFAPLPREEALRAAAWACFLDAAPKKHDINDITYIPVDEQTLGRKNGDLMILYDLLPEIAVQAYERLHAKS